MKHLRPTDRHHGQRRRWVAAAATGLVFAGFLAASPAAWAAPASDSAAPAAAKAAAPTPAAAVKPWTSKVVVTTKSATIAPGTVAPVTIAVTSGGKPLAGVVATITYAGRTVTSSRTSSAGTTSVYLANLAGGRNAIVARYAGDAIHSPAAGSLAITVHAASTVRVTASDLTPDAYGRVTVGWKVTAAGRPVSYAPVKVAVRSSLSTVRSQWNGGGTLVLRGLAPGAAKVWVTYAGDAEHGAAAGYLVLSVIGGTTVAASVDPVTATPDKAVTVSFRVSSGATAMRGNVAVTFAGVSRTVTLDSAGRGSFTIPGGTFGTGEHTIRVSYAGSTYYTGSSRTLTVTTVRNTACPAWASACVDLTNNTTWLQSNGKITYGPVPMSSGRPGFRTTAGTFVVYWKDKDHVSTIYDAAMPNAVFFHDGMAFHEGNVYVESHGCIHLTASASQTYWDNLHYGNIVVVFGYAQY